MKLQNRNVTMWLIRTIGVLTFAFAALFGGTSQALAHDDDEVVTYGPNACTAIADLPVYQSSTCLKHESELDDGVTEVENDYVTQASADTVRLFFENAFSQNGWTVIKSKHDARDTEWEYTIVKDNRRVKVEVEAQKPHRGTGTEFSIEEK